MTMIRVGATPEPFNGTALFFDGESAQPQQARLGINEHKKALAIWWGEITDASQVIYWPLADLRLLRDQADQKLMTLRLAGDSATRLVLSDPEAQKILKARAPNLRKAPPMENKGRLIGWAVAAVASVAVMVLVLIPLLANSLAGFIPPRGERVLGQATLGQIRSAMNDTGLEPLAFCEAPDGVAALTAMGDRLFPDGIPDHEVAVYVLDHDMVNAFALPGGIVVFFRGLIEESERAEEVAAVYAHEIGHVVARDPTRMALRSAGSIGVLGLLFGDFAGGAVVLMLTNQIIAAQHSQTAEAAADAYAHDAMVAAGLDAGAMADFFERLLEQHGDVPPVMQHFMAHPQLRDRITAARSVEAAQSDPVLTPDQWAALRRICD